MTRHLRTVGGPCLLALVVTLLVPLMLQGCTSTAAPPQVRNVILITVDTLRADHLSAYGYARPTSPQLDAWAAGNVLFTQARAQASCTFPSVNTIFTGRFPDAFLGQPDGRMGIPESVPALASILSAAGFSTYAVSSSPIVRRTPSQFNPEGGFDRGFQVFDETCEWQPANCVRLTGEKLLREHDPTQPFFLYLHFLDPHGPYNPPPQHQRKWAVKRTGLDFIDRGRIETLASGFYKGTELPPWGPEHIQHLVDLYDDEINYFDSEFGLLLAALDSRDILADTAVLLTADHGEEFLEHQELKHCRTVYDTEVKIPLILSAPGQAPGLRVDQPVMNVDLAPTILDLLSLPTAEHGFEGRSLLPLLDAGAPDPRPLSISTQRHFVGATNGQHKLIIPLGQGGPLLYDLTSDPGETTDLAASQPQVTRQLRGALRRWQQQRKVDEADGLANAAEAEQRLKALGYLQ